MKKAPALKARFTSGMSSIITRRLTPPKAFGVVTRAIQFLRRCPRVRHSESVLWRTSVRQRLWRSDLVADRTQIFPIFGKIFENSDLQIPEKMVKA